MKKIILLCLFLGFYGSLTAQDSSVAYKDGEWLKFRLHYGFLNASYATLHLTKASLEKKPLFHVVAKGKTTGWASIFFKVDILMKVFLHPKKMNP